MRVGDWLRGRGHDVVHLREQGRQALSDREIFASALADQRIVLTFDLDFGEIAAATGGAVGRVLVLRLGDPRWSHVVGRLDTVMRQLSDSQEGGAQCPLTGRLSARPFVRTIVRTYIARGRRAGTIPSGDAPNPSTPSRLKRSSGWMRKEPIVDSATRKCAWMSPGTRLSWPHWGLATRSGDRSRAGRAGTLFPGRDRV